MCHFVSATLPNSAALERIEALGPIPVRFERVSNPGIERQLLPGENYCEVWGLDRGGCHCGTILGMGRAKERTDERGKSQRFKEAARLRKKGWSESKVQAWLDQKEQAAARVSGANPAPSAAAEAQAWLRVAERVLRDAKVEHLGLLLHFYRRGVETESFDLRFEDLALEDFDEARMRRFDEDVLYRIRA